MLKLLSRAAGSAARALCAWRGAPLVEALSRGVNAFQRHLNNVNFDMVSNGELRVLRCLAKFELRRAFDVGASEGEWSRALSELCPEAEIHAFEVVPSTFASLVSRTRGLANFKPNSFGLSDREGTLEMHLGSDSSTATGCKLEGVKSHEVFYTRSTTGIVRQAADYVREHGIDTIDIVKIDVEGMDLSVIRGFGEELRRVRVFQFEYGIFNIASHDLLLDFWRLFKRAGFVVGRVYPRMVAFAEYRWDMENFHGGNFLAVRTSETDLVRALSRRSG